MRRDRDSLQAGAGRSAQLHFSAPGARNRAFAVSMDVSETPLRLPARLHHRNVHPQPAAGKLMALRTEATPLTPLLAERIRARGPITFAEYMETCLYHPEHGYYAKPMQDSRRDYFTSVDAGPVFGRLLARQFLEMWIQMGRTDPFW